MAWLLALAYGIPWSGAFAAEAEVYAERLASLRSEVESLSEQVELQREQTRAELRSFGVQQTDLETQLRREQLRLTGIQHQVEQHTAALQVDTVSAEVLVPMLVRAMAQLEEQIGVGLPFHRDERLAELLKLANQLEEGTLSPSKCASRLWQQVEDELRLTREVALDHQVIEVDGAGIRVDVARVGMVVMYFRAQDDRFGVARRSDDGWVWSAFDDRVEVEQVSALFHSLDTQVRVGFFELPGALTEAL